MVLAIPPAISSHSTSLRRSGPRVRATGRRMAGTEDVGGIPRLMVCSASGASERQLSERAVYLEMNDGTDRRDVMGGPQWSPKSDAIAFLSERDGAPGVGVWVVDAGSGQPRQVLRHRADDRSVKWSPDGRKLAFIGHRDGRDNLFVGEVDSEPEQLTYDRWDNTDPDWSPDGLTLAFVSQRSDKDLFSNSICTIPSAGGEVRRLTDDDRANDRSPKWSPDGRRIAFVSNREDIDDIWLVHPDGTNLTKLTHGSGDKGDPRWSADGRLIAYTRVADGGIVIETIPAAGGEPAVVVSGGANTLPRWSPDGLLILYSHSDSTHPEDLWVADVKAADRSGHRQVTHTAGRALESIAFAPSSVVSFMSRDGIEVQGLLYQPPPGPSKRGPAIVWVRGGPNAVHVDGWHPLLQFFAQRGYTIVAPNYRGSTGSGRAFMEANFGTTTKGDMEDWLGAADYLRGLPTVDPDRVAIMGRSYGGYAVLLALGLHPKEFQAGVAFCAPSNWFKYWEDCEIGWGRRLHIKLMGVPSLNREVQALRSPHTYVDRFADPVLIFQGTEDIGVPVRQATDMADLLRAHGKQYECVIYPGEGHVYTGPFAIKDSAARIEGFLHAHLGPS